jgi:hypothetical protein
MRPELTSQRRKQPRPHAEVLREVIHAAFALALDTPDEGGLVAQRLEPLRQVDRLYRRTADVQASDDP